MAALSSFSLCVYLMLWRGRMYSSLAFRAAHARLSAAAAVAATATAADRECV